MSIRLFYLGAGCKLSRTLWGQLILRPGSGQRDSVLEIGHGKGQDKSSQKRYH